MSTLKLDTLSNKAGTASVPSDTIVSGTAKAWVNFNGTGTVAIRRAFNVSSITDQGTGIYTVNFTNAMQDTNFSATAWDDYYGTGWATAITSPSSIQTKRYNAASSYYDPVTCFVTIFS
jgi:hypothetical protein